MTCARGHAPRASSVCRLSRRYVVALQSGETCARLDNHGMPTTAESIIRLEQALEHAGVLQQYDVRNALADLRAAFLDDLERADE